MGLLRSRNKVAGAVALPWTWTILGRHPCYQLRGQSHLNHQKDGLKMTNLPHMAPDTTEMLPGGGSPLGTDDLPDQQVRTAGIPHLT